MEHALELVAVPVRRPQFQLGIARRPEPDQIRVAARDDVEGGDDLRVAAIEPFVYQPDGPSCAARAIGYVRGIMQAG